MTAAFLNRAEEAAYRDLRAWASVVASCSVDTLIGPRGTRSHSRDLWKRATKSFARVRARYNRIRDAARAAYARSAS